MISPSVTFVVMYLVWYKMSACEVSWVKNAFHNGYQGAFDSSNCLINRSEVIRMIVLNLMVSTMYLRVLMDVGKQELFNML